MPISLSKYVDITSGVGGAAAVAQRDLILRLFTTNALVPTNSVVTFTSASDVGDYFGTASEEYARAVFYFGWVSKQVSIPQKISFTRWAESAVAATIYGEKASYLVSTFTGISTGSLTLTLHGITHTITGINLTAAGSLSAVAGDIQTAIQGADVDAAWASATVTYNSTRGSFDFVGGVTGACNLSVGTPGSGINLAPLIGWGTGDIVSQGIAAQTVSDVLDWNDENNDNFGGIVFMPLLGNTDVVSVAAWVKGTNVKYMFSQRTSDSNAATLQALVSSYGGTGLTLDLGVSGEYPDMVPPTILAATDYNRPGANTNYMYNQFTLTPSVTTDSAAATYDAIAVNYYGQTQSAGQLLSFYQDGVLQGTTSDPRDMNVYANEMWLRSALTADMMNLLVAEPALPASNTGVGKVLAVLQADINLALINGVIEPGKTLTTAQQAYIATITNQANAWKQVQNIGYWVNATIESYVEASITKYKCNFTLVYSKGDAVRKITGEDILI